MHSPSVAHPYARTTNQKNTKYKKYKIPKTKYKGSLAQLQCGAAIVPGIQIKGIQQRQEAAYPSRRRNKKGWKNMKMPRKPFSKGFRILNENCSEVNTKRLFNRILEIQINWYVHNCCSAQFELFLTIALGFLKYQSLQIMQEFNKKVLYCTHVVDVSLAKTQQNCKCCSVNDFFLCPISRTFQDIVYGELLAQTAEGNDLSLWGIGISQILSANTMHVISCMNQFPITIKHSQSIHFVTQAGFCNATLRFELGYHMGKILRYKSPACLQLIQAVILAEAPKTLVRCAFGNV